MGLSDDQRAMLRLLAERGEQGYEDIAALKGVDVEQVRAEMKDALAAAAGEEAAATPDAAPAPTESAPAEPKREESAPTPPARPAPPRPSAPSKPRRLVGASIPPERRRFLIAAGAALAVLAAALILFALIGDDGDSGSTTANAEGAAGKLTQANLEPVSGQSGEGRAIFGRVGKEEIVLQVAAQGLEPNTGGESYTVWLFRTPKVALRVGAVKVDDSGRLGAQFPIPAELLAYVAGGAFKQIYVSRTADAAYERVVAQAKKEKKLPPYSGETVLRGTITGPIANGAPGENG
jgi:hypothetical protein